MAQQMNHIPDALLNNILNPLRSCLNIKSRRYSDIQCKSIATHGEFCARHSKNPVRFSKAPYITNHYNPIHEQCIRKIQRAFCFAIAKRRYRRQGPAANNTSLSENRTDLHSMEDITTIPKLYIWSYKDEANHIWTFDIRSFSHMGSSRLKNPYTQLPLTHVAKDSLEARLNWLRAKRYAITFINDSELTSDQQFNLRVLEIFMKMDFLGYHSDPEWFTDLDLQQNIRLYKELYDLWNFRLALTNGAKQTICPGLELKRDPARMKAQRELRWWRKQNLEILDALVSRATDKSNRALGTMYCLSALCTVSSDVKEAYEWLAQ